MYFSLLWVGHVSCLIWLWCPSDSSCMPRPSPNHPFPPHASVNGRNIIIAINPGCWRFMPGLWIMIAQNKLVLRSLASALKKFWVHLTDFYFAINTFIIQLMPLPWPFPVYSPNSCDKLFLLVFSLVYNCMKEPWEKHQDLVEITKPLSYHPLQFKNLFEFSNQLKENLY